jgi:O-antigen/teichoic acid export membrane protein
MSLKRKLISNTFFSALPRVGTAVFGFFLVPILIFYLGMQGFGIWSVMTSFMTYLFILDLGLNISLVRQVADSISREKINELHGFITIVFLTYFAVAIPLFLVTFFYKENLCVLFDVLHMSLKRTNRVISFYI